MRMKEISLNKYNQHNKGRISMRFWRLIATILLILGVWGALDAADAANTDGTVAFRATTASYSAPYNPDNIAAVWVVNSSNQFVKTLCRHAKSRINYLTQWNAARGSYTNVDGVSGATLTSQPQTHAVTWDCRDRYGAVVPDGVYYLRAEYTSANGSGPYSASHCRFVKGTSAVTTNYPNLSAGGGTFSAMSLTYTPAITAVGDVAVTAMTPTSGNVNSTVAVQITVANRGSSAASFPVVLSNMTTRVQIGSQQVNSLAAGASTTVPFNWNTAGLAAGSYQLRSSAGPIAGEVNLADNTRTTAVTLVALVHDVAVNSLTAPAAVRPNTLTNVTIGVANIGNYSESFNLTLSDMTAGQTIGARTIAGLAAGGSSNVTFTWNTTNAALGVHTLQAVAATVTGETNTANNTRFAATMVAVNMETNVLVAKGSTWKYLDAGLDISGAPWMKTGVDYYDGFWASGRAPLGYGLPNLGTTVNYGGNPAQRYTTTYFRREFTMDVAPMTINARVMRDDGVVLYLNGVEIARQNMPAGPVTYATAASANLTGANATNYFSFTIAPSNLLVGRNILAAEVHQSAPTNSSLGFDLELVTLNPATPRNYRIAPVSVTPDGSVQAGDALGVTVVVSNPGNAATSFTVFLKDAATGAILASQQVNALAPGESTEVRLTWSTLGATAGSHTLQAVAVYNGVTNAADVATATVSVAAPAFVNRKVSAVGSIGGRCGAVAAVGNYVYVGCGATLEIWDGTTPSNPVKVGQIALPGNIVDLAGGTGWVYVAAGASGVHIVDVRTPSSPVHSITFDSSGNARRLGLSGSLLYVADGLSGVRILNVANPAAPTLAGSYQTAGPAQAIGVNGQTLSVLDGHDGLQMLSAANPAAPILAGAYRRITAGLDLATVSGATLVSDANGGLHRINTTAPATPTLATSVLLPAAGRALALTGQALYVAAGAGGLLTVNPTTLAVLANSAIAGGEGSDVAVSASGQTLYVAAGFAGCQAWDIGTAPLAPRLLKTFSAGARPVDAAASGTTLFVAGDEGGLQVHSLANPALPTLLASISSMANARCVTLAGSLAYVADGLGKLSILDISQAGSPVQVGSYQANGLSQISRLAVSGSRAVITDGNQIQLINVANPAAPALAASSVPGGYVFDLAATTSHVFAACGGSGLRVYGLASLNAVGSYSTPGPAMGVTVNGNYAHVANGANGWQTLNVANPAAPTLVKTSAGRVVGVASAASMVALIDGQIGAQLMNASSPATPVVSRTFTGLTQPMRVGMANNRIFASEDEAGLLILDSGMSELSVSLATLTASCTAGQNASAQTFDVWNLGSGSLNYSIGDNATWLSVAPANGTSTGEHDRITATYNTASLAAGTYSATISVTSTNALGSPKTIAVSLTVLPVANTPVLAVSVTSISAQCAVDRDATNQTFDVWNAGGGQLSYRVSENAGWLSRSSSSGTSTGEHDRITMRFDTDDLNAGTYTAAITVTSTNGTGSPKTIPVTLTVAPVSTTPVLAVNVASLSAQCGVDRDATNLYFEVWNSGPGRLNYSVSDNVGWVSRSPSSGTSTGEHDRITLSFDSDDLHAGTYTATITVTSTNGAGSPKTIPLTLTVGAAPSPVLSVSPASLTAACPAGQNAAGQTAEVWNSGGGTMTYSIVDNASWLSVSPTSGTSAGEHDPLAITFNTAGLAVGAYAANITITSGNGPGSPKTIPVTLTVSPVAAGPIVVDNTNGPNSVVLSGRWTLSASVSGYWGRNYLHDGNSGKGSKSVRFIPNLTQSGRYEVAIWYSANSGRASSVPVDIVSADGSRTVTVNQRINGGRWVVLGTNSFVAGTSGSIRIRNNGTSGYVVADAVRFVRVGDSVPPPEEDDDDDDDDEDDDDRTYVMATEAADAWTSSDVSDAFPAGSLVDSDTNTLWVGAANGAPWRAVVDLGRMAEVSNLQVEFDGQPWKSMGMVVSKDGSSWVDYKTASSSPLLVRYVYLYFWGAEQGTNAPTIKELLWNEE
ncbi:MAG TPA: hypothetical protein DCZ95_04220 [Verrucomicrobia bacterium]|nr:MAG: hypothetical protein A2X46_15195 [Lentisphaerae bacterium GWF2_57_35]HBA83281.1 hypothetical protein [Verrucomicrobiota bacterium]